MHDPGGPSSAPAGDTGRRFLEQRIDELERALAQEVAKRKQAEEALQLRERAMATATDGILIADARQDDLPIIYANKSFEKICGYPAAEIIGRNCRFLQGADTEPQAVARIRAALREQRDCRVTLLNYRKDGTPFWNELRLSPVRDGADRVTHFLGVQTDVTERIETEQMLRDARQAAEAASRSKSEFLANMSHEIRSPMSAILGYVDILAAQTDDPYSLDCVEIIKRNGRYLLNIVNDILDLSKIEAGKLEIQLQRCSPAKLLADVRSLMDVRAQEKQLPLEVEYESRIPETIETDPVRLRQILINLLSNAIKFADQGYIKLSVSHLGDGDTSQLQFAVSDTGIGISEEQQQRLFQPFTQADTSHARSYDGAGLGLAISQRLARMLNGELSVRSALNQGTTVTVTLPTGTLDGVALIAPQDEITGDVSTATPAQLKLNSRVLVVDDRSDIRYLVQYFLEQAGARVVAVENGKTALEAIAQGEKQNDCFDIVIIDMQMPVLDGYQTTARLRARRFDRPIIALTAAAMQGEREKCLQAGCDDFVTKPIDGYRLVELVARYEQAAIDPQAALAPDAGSAASTWRCRILIVDDNEDVSNALCKLLGMLQYEVRVAHDGRSAIAAAQAHRPDVIIADIGLPDIDGFEVARRLRALHEFDQTVFIALSGSGSGEARFKAAGFNHYVLKPASINDLLPLFPVRDTAG